jgi:hypothetical protein
MYAKRNVTVCSHKGFAELELLEEKVTTLQGSRVLQLGKEFPLSAFIVIIIIIKLNCKVVLTRRQWYYNKTQHTKMYMSQNNTPLSNKHSTQSYTNNKGHITHNKYDTDKQ